MKEKILTSIADSSDFRKKYNGVMNHCFKPSIVSTSDSNTPNSHNIGTFTPSSSVSGYGWINAQDTVIQSHYGNTTGCDMEPPTAPDSDYQYPYSIQLAGHTYLLENTEIGTKTKQFLEASHNFANGYNDSEITHGAEYTLSQTTSVKGTPHTMYLYNVQANFTEGQKGWKWLKHACSSVASGVKKATSSAVSAAKSATSSVANFAKATAGDATEIACDAASATADVAEEVGTAGAATAAEPAEIGGEEVGCTLAGEAVDAAVNK